MTVDDRFRRSFEEMAETRRSIERLENTLQQGGSGPTIDGMETRVSKLETHFEYVRRDLDEIRADQKTIIAALGALPTKRDLTNNVVAITTVALAVVAITVGGIIGGLGWLDRDRPDPEPTPSSSTVQPVEKAPA